MRQMIKSNDKCNTFQKCYKMASNAIIARVLSVTTVLQCNIRCYTYNSTMTTICYDIVTILKYVTEVLQNMFYCIIFKQALQ